MLPYTKVHEVQFFQLHMKATWPNLQIVEQIFKSIHQGGALLGPPVSQIIAELVYRFAATSKKEGRLPSAFPTPPIKGLLLPVPASQSSESNTVIIRQTAAVVLALWTAPSS